MRYYLFILAFLLLPFSPAQALSCAEPVMDAKAIESAAVIFEGTVSERGDEVQKGTDDMRKSRVFTFTVSKAWKGTEAGATVAVWRNTYWGDDFAEGVEYLVVAHKDGDVLEAGLCGLTARKEHAEKSLKALEKHFKQ